MKKNELETILLNTLSSIPDSRVKYAMEYSLMGGGKRIRPMLLYEVLKGYGIEESIGNPFACALEMIHTYSLIHDDLPAMDNDELRRGRPTCHIQYDEATAILAGDGLLTHAFTMLSQANVDSTIIQRCLSILSVGAGPCGMVYGQNLDMDELHKKIWDDLVQVHRYKTGCLLSAPLEMGAVFAKQSEPIIKTWREIGFDLGLAFQIQDDLLDVLKTEEELGKSNSDERNHKVTSVTLLGQDKATDQMNNLYYNCCIRIQEMSSFHGEDLISLIQSIQHRNY